jgi:hypothetical protein
VEDECSANSRMNFVYFLSVLKHVCVRMGYLLIRVSICDLGSLDFSIPATRTSLELLRSKEDSPVECVPYSPRSRKI